MDIETENVINLIFPEESWKENPNFYQYLSKLGGFDVDQLSKEPDHLSDEKNAVLQTTQKLVFANYKTFIQTAESSREILNHFNETENRLDKLVQKIPEFVRKCQSFCDTSKDINAHRRLNSLTLTRNAELLEILEMPQLMESCLRSNQYNEALELSQYARQLGMKHGDIPIISSIVAEIESSWSGMVGQVVGSLRGDLPLPRCLQLVGLLRSMDAFTESELRIKFLQARDSWLQGLLNAIPKEDPNLHMAKTIELSRIHLFNIITQYKAMFNDDELVIPGRDLTLNESAIFYHWLEEKITQFLATLEQDLPGVTSIDTILGQCTYFGLSFGRVGVDFTGRMSDIFVRVISERFEQNVRRTTRKFEKDMETFTLINKTQRLDVKTEPCINSTLIYYYKLFAFTAAERENMIKFTECLSEQLIPYIQYCIHAIFPPAQIATHLGVSVGVLQKEEITYLNKQIIVEPVAVLLPIRKDCLTSKSCMSNIQPLTSHDARNPSITMPLLIETIDSNLRKTTVIKTEKSKENEITQQGTI
ncbi:Conserved oligomeric Golgi complex subunit 8 [Trachymyrmex zeteki]|uniref:Conserved oligomeric Golgi complex subunit 8 n=1 Tax=Mycetomoellerius zeteki TaxID=64791 RepID=A0A151WST8_9HYME|nr:Conserved oligomeric Golgi complex subunit 8 [Trachymyrmex zeteki]